MLFHGKTLYASDFPSRRHPGAMLELRSTSSTPGLRFGFILSSVSIQKLQSHTHFRDSDPPPRMQSSHLNALGSAVRRP